MKNIELFFESPWLLLIAIPALLAVFFACRWMRHAEKTPLAEKCALVLRVLEVVLAVLILAGFSVVIHSSDTQMIVLADRSDSMAAAEEQVDACLAEIEQRDEKRSLLGVMDFAANAGTLHAAGQKPDTLPEGNATDLASALEAAEASFSGDAGRRIVLMTDGVATDGQLETVMQKLTDEGIRVDAIPFDTSIQSPEVELTGFALPADAAEGQRFPANLTVLSSGKAEGMLRICDGDKQIYEEEVHLLPGENAYTCSLNAAEPGLHEYRAELLGAEDTFLQNNVQYGVMNVNNGTKILLVDGTGTQTASLQALLEEAGYEVSAVPCSQMPETVSDLCAYGLCILMNVNAKDLPEGTAEKLEEYVSEYGRSVMTTGGENTYFYGGMEGTAFERFLPVDMCVEEKESVDPIALMLVMDVTDSMRTQAMGTPIEMARRSAIKCVNDLNANDYAGVITFSDDAEVLVEMTSMKDKEAVISAINGIETAGPEHLTKFTDALRTACDQLKTFDKLDRKHVLFITDGSPADTGFEPIVHEMKKNKITLSTIAVGKMLNVVKLLEGLAEAGGGRCYFVENAYDLPDIITMDTTLLQVDYTSSEPFVPQIVHPEFPVQQEELTQLFGCIRTSAKNKASVALEAPDGQPVYVQWDYGKGRAASFMSDLSGDWSRSWFASEAGRQLIVSMVKALIPGTVDQSAVDVQLQPGGSEGLLLLNGEQGEAQQITVQLTSPEGESYAAPLQKMDENVYGCRVPLTVPGVYEAVLSWKDEAGQVLGTHQTHVVQAWSSEYEMISRPNGAEALMELCAAAGGAVVTSAANLMAIDLGVTDVRYDAALPIAVVLMVCLTADIVVRKTQMKHLPGRKKKNK